MNTLGVTAFHHVAVSVGDMEKMVSFFCEKLGFEVEIEDPNRSGEPLDKVIGLEDVKAHVVLLKGYGVHIELLKFKHPEGEPRAAFRQCDHGFTHICLKVADIDKAYGQMLNSGARFTTAPQNLRPGVWATYILGPEQLIVELAQYDEP